MAHLGHSSDILFPEDEPSQSAHDDSFYSPPSVSSQSTYSREVKYIFDPQYGRCSNYSDISSSVDHEQEAQDHVSEDIYTSPRVGLYPSRIYRNNSFLDTSLPLSKEALASRRKTWSPPTCRRMMGSASSSVGLSNHSQKMRSYRSNEQLDVDNGNFYEDLDSLPPPKLTPVSGSLNNRNAHQNLIKPIAFKPVFTPRPRYVSTPQRPSPVRQTPPRQTPPEQTPARQAASYPPPPPPPPVHRGPPPPYPRDPHESSAMRSANHSQDSGYLSQDCQAGIHSHSNSNLSQGSVALDSASATYATVDTHRSFERPESFASSNVSTNSRMSSNHQEVYLQTPSPSDSGVGLTELEAMLREKDTEIQQLRDTMEKNETAIVQVYEERRQNFEMELREVHTEWDQRLKFQQQKSFKTEQALLLQLFRLQQERKNLRLDVDQLRTEKERLERKYSELEEGVQASNSKTEEVQWDLCQKTGEISLLKSQLKEAKDDTSNKSNELVSVRTQLKDVQQQSASKAHEIETLHAEIDNVRKELIRVQDELQKTQEARTLAQSQSPGASPPQAKDSTAMPQQEIEKLKAELEAQTVQMQREREQWLEEKNKVIRYQKHLQLNYVQMYRKNKSLEAEVEQLTLELENVNMQPVREGRILADDSEPQESMC